MSTRCTIWVPKEDCFVGIYCHFDGYPSGVGDTLLKFYNDRKSAEDLIDLGNLSCLEENLYPKEGSTHSFDSPQKNVTIAYYRDRGEDFKQFKAYTTSQIRRISEESWAEFIYLWSNEENSWVILD